MGGDKRFCCVLAEGTHQWPPTLHRARATAHPIPPEAGQKAWAKMKKTSMKSIKQTEKAKEAKAEKAQVDAEEKVKEEKEAKEEDKESAEPAPDVFLLDDAR